MPSGGVERERLAVAVQVAERVQRRASAVAAPSDDGAGQLVGKVRGDRPTERVDRDADRPGTVQGADGVGERAPGCVVRAGCGLDHVVLVIVGHTGGVVAVPLSATRGGRSSGAADGSLAGAASRGDESCVCKHDDRMACR